jgi:hypothetical protein
MDTLLRQVLNRRIVEVSDDDTVDASAAPATKVDNEESARNSKAVHDSASCEPSQVTYHVKPMSAKIKVRHVAVATGGTQAVLDTMTLAEKLDVEVDASRTLREQKRVQQQQVDHMEVEISLLKGQLAGRVRALSILRESLWRDLLLAQQLLQHQVHSSAAASGDFTYLDAFKLLESTDDEASARAGSSQITQMIRASVEAERHHSRLQFEHRMVERDATIDKLQRQIETYKDLERNTQHLVDAAGDELRHKHAIAMSNVQAEHDVALHRLRSDLTSKLNAREEELATAQLNLREALRRGSQLRRRSTRRFSEITAPSLASSRHIQKTPPNALRNITLVDAVGASSEDDGEDTRVDEHDDEQYSGGSARGSDGDDNVRVSSLEGRLSTAEQALHDREKDITKLKILLAQASQDRAASTNVADDLRAKISQLEFDLTAVTAANGNLTAELETAKEAVKQLQLAAAPIKPDSASASVRGAKGTTENGGSNAELQQALETLSDRLDTAESHREAAEAQFEQLSSKHQSLQQTCEQLKKTCEGHSVLKAAFKCVMSSLVAVIETDLSECFRRIKTVTADPTTAPADAIARAVATLTTIAQAGAAVASGAAMPLPTAMQQTTMSVTWELCGHGLKAGKQTALALLAEACPAAGEWSQWPAMQAALAAARVLDLGDLDLTLYQVAKPGTSTRSPSPSLPSPRTRSASASPVDRKKSVLSLEVPVSAQGGASRRKSSTFAVFPVNLSPNPSSRRGSAVPPVLSVPFDVSVMSESSATSPMRAQEPTAISARTPPTVVTDAEVQTIGPDLFAVESTQGKDDVKHEVLSVVDFKRRYPHLAQVGPVAAAFAALRPADRRLAMLSCLTSLTRADALAVINEAHRRIDGCNMVSVHKESFAETVTIPRLFDLISSTGKNLAELDRDAELLPDIAADVAKASDEISRGAALETMASVCAALFDRWKPNDLVQAENTTVYRRVNVVPFDDGSEDAIESRDAPKHGDSRLQQFIEMAEHVGESVRPLIELAQRLTTLSARIQVQCSASVEASSAFATGVESAVAQDAVSTVTLVRQLRGLMQEAMYEVSAADSVTPTKSNLRRNPLLTGKLQKPTTASFGANPTGIGHRRTAEEAASGLTLRATGSSRPTSALAKITPIAEDIVEPLAKPPRPSSALTKLLSRRGPSSLSANRAPVQRPQSSQIGMCTMDGSHMPTAFTTLEPSTEEEIAELLPEYDDVSIVFASVTRERIRPSNTLAARPTSANVTIFRGGASSSHNSSAEVSPSPVIDALPARAGVDVSRRAKHRDRLRENYRIGDESNPDAAIAPSKPLANTENATRRVGGEVDTKYIGEHVARRVAECRSALPTDLRRDPRLHRHEAARSAAGSSIDPRRAMVNEAQREADQMRLHGRINAIGMIVATSTGQAPFGGP